MLFAAHLSKSEDDSLESKINNFRSAYAAYRDIKTSQSLHQQSQMQNTLGTKEELEEANTVIKNSLDKAAKNLDSKDLVEARKQGLISDFEARDISALFQEKGSSTSSKENKIQENKQSIAAARASMNSKTPDKSKDKGMDR